MSMRTLCLGLAAALGLLLVTRARAAEAVSYRLVPRVGRLVIEASTGEVVPWACYSLGPDLNVEGWKRKQPGFIQAGVRLFQLPLMPLQGQMWEQPFWSLDGQPVAEPAAGANWAEQVPWLLAQAPDARVILRFGLHPSPAWAAVHPEQFQTLSNQRYARAGTAGQSILPSLASDLWLAGIERQIRDTVAWCERQPWRDCVVGYTLFPYCEGATEVGVFGELFDTSPPMQEAFRAFARERYGTDEALRRAWDDPDVTLATARVPTRAEWRARKAALQLMHWPDPARVGRERDYFLLQQRLFLRFWDRVLTVLAETTAARPVVKGADILKQPLQGWMHNAAFDAEWYPGMRDDYGPILFASGSFGIERLLDHPGLDMLQTPGMYYNRAMGYAWEAEGLSDSLLLRGKLNFMEADMRTWVDRDVRGKPRPPGSLINDAGAFLTPAEMNAGFDRTLAWALTRNQMYYYASVCGANWWYDDPLVYATITRQLRLAAASARRPWAPNPDAICVVIDDASPLEEDFSSGFQHLAVYRQIEEGLALCGVPYRIHLLSDLARPDFPPYKCYLFPNLFRVDADTEALLRRTVLREGRVALFGPGTGITDGTALSAAGLTRLLGVPMELLPRSCARRTMLQDHGHPLSARLPQATFGDSYAFGPLLVPAVQRFPAASGTAPRVTPLGATFFHYFLDRPGLFVVDHGRGPLGTGADDYSVVFSAALPLPPELLRECARYAGCHVWSDENAVVYAAPDFVALHTVRRGEQRLRLPPGVAAWDALSGRRAGRWRRELRITADAPGTFLFWLGQPPPE